MKIVVFSTVLLILLRNTISSDQNKIGEPSKNHDTYHENVYLPPVKNNPLNSKFGISYKENISNSKMFVFKFSETFDKTQAIRVHVNSPNADPDSPIIFVVKEKQSVLSWQLPFIAQDQVLYYNVSRTLCNAFEMNQYSGILIEVSTMDKKNVTFILTANIIDLDITTNDTIDLTTSEPMHFKYSMGNESSVMVMVDSEDDHCLLFSVKQIQCPVEDAITNTQYFTGLSQTVSRSGAITVKKGQYINDEFYIVLALLPIDYDCVGISTIIVPSKLGDMRKKKLTLSVVPNFSVVEKWLAIFAGFIGFFTIYMFSIIVNYTYHCKLKISRARYLKSQINNREPNEDDPLLCDDTFHSPGTSGYSSYTVNTTSGSPVAPSPLAPSSHPAPPSSDLPAPAPAPPSSVPPSVAASLASPSPRSRHPCQLSAQQHNEIDVDLLADVELDKNIIRSKKEIFVSDLSMKPSKKLLKKYTLYFRNLIPISIFYVLPVIQLVLNYQSMLDLTGNEDICYFNFRCTNPMGVLHSFNNIYSNIGYVMLGVLFLVLVRFRQKRVKMDRLDDPDLETKGIPNNFGLFYAMGIALVMEGILSSCYHVCPNYSNFQFDTAFMYITACILMLAIYHKRHPDISPHSHTSYTLMSLVILVEVIGVVNPSVYLWVVFIIAHIVFTLILSLQIYFHGSWKLNIHIFKTIYYKMSSSSFWCTLPMYLDRAILLTIAILINIAISAYGFTVKPPFANFLLAIFIINLMMYFAFYTIMKLRHKERITLIPAIYILLGTVFWAAAFYFYFWSTTSWHFICQTLDICQKLLNTLRNLHISLR